MHIRVVVFAYCLHVRHILRIQLLYLLVPARIKMENHWRWNGRLACYQLRDRQECATAAIQSELLVPTVAKFRSNLHQWRLCRYLHQPCLNIWNRAKLGRFLTLSDLVSLVAVVTAWVAMRNDIAWPKTQRASQTLSVIKQLMFVTVACCSTSTVDSTLRFNGWFWCGEHGRLRASANDRECFELLVIIRGLVRLEAGPRINY